MKLKEAHNLCKAAQEKPLVLFDRTFTPEYCEKLVSCDLEAQAIVTYSPNRVTNGLAELLIELEKPRCPS